MKPCFMMSPLSLAKYLPSQAMNFDLLVIDEASQMKPEDALGGLLRARQVIVVGDRNQLPPTDFFTRVTPAEEFGAEADEDADDIDAESILDWALKTYQAPRRLKWHYRSRCESLIAFSNREFYSSRAGSAGDLITFPSARPGAFSIDLVRVDGSYKAGRNPAEVGRVVEAAIAFMIRNSSLPPDEIPTLGIATMNLEQREAIREEFNRAARDEAVERYLAACNAGTPTRNPEPFFVKNLENLQGDERDVIMISLTYGREPGQTRVAQRFGPISREPGASPLERAVHAGAAARRGVFVDGIERRHREHRQPARRAGAARLPALCREPAARGGRGDRTRGRQRFRAGGPLAAGSARIFGRAAGRRRRLSHRPRR